MLSTIRIGAGSASAGRGFVLRPGSQLVLRLCSDEVDEQAFYAWRVPLGVSDSSAPETLWPSWTPIAEACVVALLAVAVVPEHRPGLPLWARLGLVSVPVVVFALDAASRRPPRSWVLSCGGVPRYLLVFGATAVLLLYPAKFDAAPFFLAVIIGEAAALAPTWQSATLALGSSGLLIGLQISGRWDDGALIWLLAFGWTWGGVHLLQSRARLLDELRAHAVIEERQRIARELHDVVAHSLAVTMLQLTGARLALERDPKDATRALEEAERLGRQSLAEIRRTVGLLSPDDQNASATALPSASDIPALVREVRDAGLEVELSCVGDLASVPPATGLNLYRIVQESLANVVKHAPGATARVAVSVCSDHVTIDVDNTLLAGATVTRVNGDAGMGLASMRERAELLGGTLTAGPHDGRWRVHLDAAKRLR
jgi:signal transduction histidine kinase